MTTFGKDNMGAKTIRAALAITWLILLPGVTQVSGQSLFVTETSQQFDFETTIDFPVEGASSVGQEFIAHIGRLDFVRIGTIGFPWLQQQITIHEGTITGAVVATSTNAHVVPGLRFDDAIFTFDGPVILSPGNRYVIKVVALNAPLPIVLGTGQDTYAEGRALVNGELISEFDLAFSVGVFVPEMVASEARAITVVEQQSVLLAPTGTFTNDYITDYKGSTLTFSLGSESSLEEDLSPHSPVIFELVQFNGEVVGAVTRTVLPRTWTVTFNSRATAAAVQHAIRQVSYVNYSEQPPAARPITVTFAHPLGTTTVPLVVEIIPVNDPPVAAPDIAVSIVIAKRGHSAPVILDASQSFDVDSASLDYLWTDETNVLANQGVRVTNSFAIGLHSVYLTVTDDDGLSSTVGSTFSVVTPHDAIKHIFDLFDPFAVPTASQRRLRAPLRQALLALAQQRPGLAKAFLHRFQQRAAMYGETDPVVGRILVQSAQTVIDGI